MASDPKNKIEKQKKKKASDKKGLKTLATDRWEDEEYAIEAAALKSPRTEGVAFRTAKKSKTKGEYKRRSLYIQKNQKVDEILNWIFLTVKNFFAKFWGKRIITEVELEANNKIVEDLRSKLRQKEDENLDLKHAFQTQQQELLLVKEVINNSNQYSKELKTFEELVIDAVNNNKNIEETVKKELKEKRWILGLDCEVKAKNKDIDTATEIDLHIETNYGEQRIIEAKSPSINLFIQKTDGGRLNLNPKISEGLSELIEYMRRTDINSGLRRKGVYAIQKPIGRILAGYNLTTDEQEVLTDWNFYLAPYIKFITYKELISNAKKEIELIIITKKFLEKS